MSETQKLATEITKLDAINSELGKIADRTDQQRKSDLVQLRREFSSQMGVVGKTAESGFLGGVDESVGKEFRGLLSNLRHAVAMHQANWPAVKIDGQNAEYKRSAKAVHEANGKLLQWARDNLRR